jgi:hypothetical protein
MKRYEPASNDYETKKPSYMPWNEDAFWGDMGVRAMTAQQRWIYRTLLQTSFFCATRPYLPNNNNQLWVLAGCVDKQQWMENKRPVMAMFTAETVDGHRLLFRKRVLEDWQRLLNKRKELHERGKRGGLASAGVRSQHKLNPGSAEADNGLTKIEVEIEEEGEVEGEEEGKVEGEEEIQEESEVKRELSLEQELSPGQDGHNGGDTSVSERTLETSLTPKGAGEGNLGSIRSSNRQLPETLSPDAKNVIGEIAYRSDGRVIPDYKQSLTIARWLETYTPDEITDAFDCFCIDTGVCERGDENTFEVRHAARNFCEKGPVLIDFARRMDRERIEAAEWEKEVARKIAASAEKPTGEHSVIEEHLTQE